MGSTPSGTTGSRSRGPPKKEGWITSAVRRNGLAWLFAYRNRLFDGLRDGLFDRLDDDRRVFLADSHSYFSLDLLVSQWSHSAVLMRYGRIRYLPGSSGRKPTGTRSSTGWLNAGTGVD